MTSRSIRLGIRANLPQFSLLVLINGFVGAMVGLERTVLPLIAEHDFGIASKSVKEAIRKIIAAENPQSPLSDKEIVRRLGDMGIEIARRTVAKYREMMRILPSSRRKKYF